MTLIPAAAATKNDRSDAMVMTRICAVANSDVIHALFPPTLASPDAMMIWTLPVESPHTIRPITTRQM